MPHESILILGTGAMACLFAGRLAAAGVPVVLMGTWPEALSSLKGEGVRLVEADGSERAYPVTVVAVKNTAKDFADCEGIKHVLVLVKSWQTERAARQVSECLSPDGVVLTLQNGLGNREMLAAYLGAPRVALGVTTLGANLLGPGRVRVAGEGVISVGIHARVKPLADLLRAANFIVETVSDAEGLLWGKLVINAAINPITALLRVPNGVLLARPPVRVLLASAARETAAVAVARGIVLPYPDPVVAVEAVARRTADNLSSMLQDVQRAAPTEVDAINGQVIHAGEQMGVSTPVNRVLWSLVKGIQSS